MNLTQAKNIFNIISFENESLDSLKEKYFKLIKIYHPDKKGDTKICAKINVAYKVLSDNIIEKTITKFPVKNINDFGTDYNFPIQKIYFNKIL